MKRKNELLEAMANELAQRHSYLKTPSLESVYLGGGTPSLLETKEIEKLLDKAREYFSFEPDVEITLEANPDDISKEKVRELKSLGINRLSIGIQSFNDKNLAFLGRMHNAKTAKSCIEDAISAGISNLTIDLIYGIPGAGNKDFLSDLKLLNSLGINHFSAYALTLEPGTIYANKVKKKYLPGINEDQIRKDFFSLVDFADANNFLHYEISNFARLGNLAVHNLNYWKGLPYLGIGPSAHSYDILSRQWNIAVNSDYIERINHGIKSFEREILDDKTKINERIMLSLRTMWGFNPDDINAEEETINGIIARLEKGVRSNLVVKNNHSYCLTTEGQLISDSIISDLFIV